MNIYIHKCEILFILAEEGVSLTLNPLLCTPPLKGVLKERRFCDLRHIFCVHYRAYARRARTRMNTIQRHNVKNDIVFDFPLEVALVDFYNFEQE